MEKISYTDRVKNEVLRMLYLVKEERNILLAKKRRKSNWAGQLLRRNCPSETLLKKREKEGWRLPEDVEEDISYWMTLRKREYTGI